MILENLPLSRHVNGDEHLVMREWGVCYQIVQLGALRLSCPHFPTGFECFHVVILLSI